VTSVTPSRRERLRAATVEEIQSTARRLLVADGLPGVTLRAISREMGMTAPALYRYYDSLESLLEALCASLYDECTGYIEREVAAVPEDDMPTRLATAARAFRRWSVGHPAEFAMMFASPIGGGEGETRSPAVHAAGMRFANAFLAMFVGLWRRAPFPAPADTELAPSLCRQFERFLAEAGIAIPIGAVQVFFSCWIRLYGMVALEVFGHLHFAFDDGEPMFEAELAEVTRQLNIRLPPAPPR